VAVGHKRSFIGVTMHYVDPRVLKFSLLLALECGRFSDSQTTVTIFLFNEAPISVEAQH